MAEAPEVVIVGGGVAGSALACRLARRGLGVAVLERDAVYEDRVRGEWLAPWGVAELNRLQLYDSVLAAGAQLVTRAVNYDELFPPEVARQNALDLSKAHPLAPGSLCIRHPVMCRVLNDTARRAGAVVMRDVAKVAVFPGAPPRVEFDLDGRHYSWRPRIVIGADGRTSEVRRQLGLTLLRDEPHNLVGGMLVDGVPEWPTNEEALGTEGSVYYLVFPQGGGMLRLYLCYGYESRQRFAGRDKQMHVLEAFRLECLPLGERIAGARPIGPYNAFPNEDAWTDIPCVPGVILIGDAAGYNDPITGQGLSIALRDVRIVDELLYDASWCRATFEPYVVERRERMRRLRIAARFAATLRVEFGPEQRARRARALRRMTSGGMPSPLRAGLTGPETVAADAFSQGTIAALLAPES